MPSQRDAALDQWIAWARTGLLYEWGGKLIGTPTAHRWDYGADCSGFVTGGWYVGTAGEVDRRGWWNADRMHRTLLCTATPKPGDLAVYARSIPKDGVPHANHVMVYVGDGRVLGACGGDEETTTAEKAKARGARVQFRAKADYRMCRNHRGERVSAFLGYRVSPFND